MATNNFFPRKSESAPMIYAYEDKYDPNLKGLLKVGYTMVGAQSDRGEKTAERFGSFVRIHYLCTIKYC